MAKEEEVDIELGNDNIIPETTGYRGLGLDDWSMGTGTSANILMVGAFLAMSPEPGVRGRLKPIVALGKEVKREEKSRDEVHIRRSRKV